MAKPWLRALLNAVRLLDVLLAGAVASVAGFAGEGGGSGLYAFLVLLIPTGLIRCAVARIPIIALGFFLLALLVIDALF